MDKNFLLKMKNAYHDYKNSAEQKDLKLRLIENEKWYRMSQYGKGQANGIPQCRSGYLFNAILVKHADAMDNFPDANILPREEKDTELAKTLSGVISYILESNDFEGVYSDNWFSKLKTSSCYSVTWDPELNHYMGDIKISKTDLLDLFWQPSVSDIQDSEFVFYHTFMTKHEFLARYGAAALEVAETVSTVDTYYEKDFSFKTDMVLVLDCYYKKYRDDKSPILHFCKFSGEYLIYASDDETDERGRKLYADGYYMHGMYPFFFDVMYPAEQCVAGFGCCDVLKPLQEYIDSLDSLIQKNNRIVGKPKYIVNDNLGISASDIADMEKEIIFTSVPIDTNMIYKLPLDVLPPQVQQARDAKITEFKEIIGNRDFQQGGTQNGVTSGTALTVMQSVGDKLGRDIIKTSYRCYKNIILCAIELVRQFYDTDRTIRIIGEDGDYKFIQFNNSKLKGSKNPQSFGNASHGFEDDLGVMDFESNASGSLLGSSENDVPYFDVKLSVQKSNPFTREMSNQTILELAKIGLFNPELFEYNLPVLRALQFEGKDNLIKEITELIDKKRNEQAQAMKNAEFGMRNSELEMQKAQGAVPMSGVGDENGDMVDITDMIS